MKFNCQLSFTCLAGDLRIILAYENKQDNEKEYNFTQYYDFYFLKQYKNIFFGLGIEKKRSKNKSNVFLLIEENNTPDIFFKQFVDLLLNKINFKTHIKYKQKSLNKIIKTFDDGVYWSYISDVNEIKRLGEIQNNILQDNEFVSEYNNDMEIYYLFNKKAEPLMFASFGRDNSKPDVISTGESENISKVFEPYVDYILNYKEQYNFMVEYEKNTLH